MAGKTPAPKKPKTVSRFRNLAGGADSPPVTDPGTDANVTGGVVGGLAAAVQAAGHRIRHVDVASLIPHPFNDPTRSQPKDGDPDWDVLIRNVKTNGVMLPGLAVSRAAFVAARPALADSLPTTGTHVLIYGHRRRAAAVAAKVTTMPVVVDDSVMADDGDLDYMASENLGRQDLSPMAEAELFARYSEHLGLSQSAIAERLGVDQATVSRRLALLLLTEEAAHELEQEQLSAAGAAALAGALPYGAPRRWQKTKHDQQDSPERKDDQIAALRLILERNTSPTRAAERILTERESRRRAAHAGIKIIDNPREVLGDDHFAHQIDDPADGNSVIAAIDDTTGALVYYDQTPSPAEESAPAAPSAQEDNSAGAHPPATPAPATPSDNEKPATAKQPTGSPSESKETPATTPPARAQKRDVPEQRLEACARAAQTIPSKARLGEILVTAVLLGVDFQHPEVIAQAEEWEGPHANDTGKANSAAAWRRTLAGYEDLVSRQGQWETAGSTYLDLLHERASHVPTTWERQQIAVMQRA